MRTALLVRPALFLLAVVSMPALAAEPAWLGAADCRIAPLKPAPSGEVSWTGGCVDGYASGKGVLAWTSSTLGKVTLDATLARGEASGEAVLKRRDYTYEGTTRNGVPDGQGYFQYEEGRGWYEGEVVDGLPHGKGTHLKADRSRYTGEWVRGKRHGWGEASFATGGSYTGGWKDNAFDGQGVIVYAGAGHKYEGVFQDGRVAGLPKAEVGEGRYSIKRDTTGSHIREDAVVAYLPLNAVWDQMAPAQQNRFRKNYPALEAGDEPPFPAKGEGSLFDKVRRINQALGPVKGGLGIYVVVGKDGKPLSVTAFGAPTATIVRALSTLFMLEQYKPALCRGEPCEMVYPVNFSFTVDD
jgi:hypothetical protein